MPPRLARLLAVIVAIALVAGAFALRGALSSDDDELTSTDVEIDMPTGAGPTDPDASSFRLACDEDLAPVCEELGLDPVRTSTVLDAAAEDDLPYDAWLTLDGMGGVLDSTRLEVGLGRITSDPLEVASSTLALLALDDPPGGCPDDVVEWTCLMDPPEPFGIGIAVPSGDTSLGTLAIAAAARSLQDGTGFGRGAYEGTLDADTVIELLDDSPSQAGRTTAQQTSAMFNPGIADASVTFDGLARLRAGTPRGGNRGMRVLALSPEVTIGVVLVGLGDDGEAAVRALGPAVTGQTVQDALTEAGWAGGAKPTSGLPEADVIYGVREELG